MAADSFDPLIDSLPSRYVVGIDLGTTNSAITYVDSTESPWSIQVFHILQPVSATDSEKLDTLPSFYYQPVSGTAPFEFCVGAYARDETAKTSGRGIASAKSWLCHAAVDRTAAVLPWHAAPDVRRLSPVEVSGAYLRHIRECWDQAFPAHPLAEQDLVLTLPASFDEVARELTIEAARQAGLTRIMLIEEPQAAFYAWVYKHERDWDQRVQVGQKILVCDIGGGTSDFTLIRVRKNEVGQDNPNGQGQRIQFHRVAVGNHLILGGDNLDLAIAKFLESKLTGGGKLEPFQWDVLVGSSRRVKEQLLSDGTADQLTVNLPGRGSRLIGGGLQIEVSRPEITELVLQGFLPSVTLDAQPSQLQSGFQELGLPYASDPAITRYLAQFLVVHAGAGAEHPLSALTQPSSVEIQQAARPDVVLFNGGFFASPILRSRLIEQIARWFQSSDDPNWQPLVLENDRLDLAVARGAAYYGMVRRDQGVKIAATLARSYYLGIGGQPAKAICIMPGSAEPGDRFSLAGHSFCLRVSQPVEFSLYVSSIRLADVPGTLVDVDPAQLSPLPPIRTVLKTKSRNEKGEIPVTLQIRLTELGTVDLACQEVDSDRRWKLQFDVRSTTQTDVAQHAGAGEAQGVFDEETWEACEQAIETVFGSRSTIDTISPQNLVRELVSLIGLEREQWPMTLLRRIWGALIEREAGRRKSQQHETRWLNLLGFALRPGYGVALDDWRVAETWRHVHNKLVHSSPGVRNELLILWRRLAGGLTRGQQLMIGEPWLAALRAQAKQLSGLPTKGTTAQLRPEDSVEVWRMLGSLELMSPDQKRELGEIALSIRNKPKLTGAKEAITWALGRFGQRQPLYGPLNTVLPSQLVEGWIESLLEPNASGIQTMAITQMARKTGDRYRDIGEDLRNQVIRWLKQENASQHLITLVREGGRLDFEEETKVFGESLPPGLRLENSVPLVSDEIDVRN